MQTSKKPRALVCYICGKEYGTKKIEKHIKLCEQKWEEEQLKLEPEERKECPQPPPGFLNILRMSLGKEPVSVAAEESLVPPVADSVKDKPSEVSKEDTTSAQVVDHSEEDTAQNLIEVGSIEEGPQDPLDSIEPAVENHESIIIPAIQPKEHQEKIETTKYFYYYY